MKTVLKRVIVALLMLPLLPFTLFVAPEWVLAVGVSLLSSLCVIELLWGTGIAPKKRMIAYAAAFAAFFPIMVHVGESKLFYPYTEILPIAIALLFLLFIEAVADPKRVTFSSICIIFTAAVAIPICFSAIIRLTDVAKDYALLPFIAAFMGDIFALFAGVKWGKRRPKILSVSPKKTLEGSIGGLLGAMLGMVVYGVVLQFVYDYDVVYPLLLIYGLVGGLAGQLGDLSMSLVKRECGIKDFSKILPGHGGLLDRFDSVLFSAPVMYAMTFVLPTGWQW